MRSLKVPICLVVVIGLVAISGLVAAAAVPTGVSGVNATVSNGTAVPTGVSGVNATVSMDVSPEQNVTAGKKFGTAATPVQNSGPVVQLNVSQVLIDEEPILLCTGNVTVDGRPAAGALVHLSFDDSGIHDCTTGEDGAFSLRVRIGPGRHSVVANVSLVDRPESMAQSARVMAEIPDHISYPVVRLNVSPVVSSEESALLCTGNVTVDGRPAAGATVHLIFDDFGILDCTTNEDGVFSLMAGIGPGSHAVVANVSSANSLQGPAFSPRVTAEIPGALPLLPMGIGGIALLAGGTGFFFWRRGRGNEEQPEDEVPPPSEEIPVAVTEDLQGIASTLAAGDLRTGIEAVYHESLARLDRQQPDARLLARTPREVREQFEGTPIAAPVTAMTTLYEAVVYSGRTPVEKDRRAMIDLFVAVFSGSERAD